MKKSCKNIHFWTITTKEVWSVNTGKYFSISMIEQSHGFLRSSLSVCKSRVESGAQCVTNGAENSTSTLAKN